MIFLDKMNDIKSKLEALGYDVVAPTLTQEEIETGADTFMNYVDAEGGVGKVLPDNDIWRKTESEIIRLWKWAMHFLSVRKYMCYKIHHMVIRKLKKC